MKRAPAGGCEYSAIFDFFKIEDVPGTSKLLKEVRIPFAKSGKYSRKNSLIRLEDQGNYLYRFCFESLFFVHSFLPSCLLKFKIVAIFNFLNVQPCNSNTSGND